MEMETDIWRRGGWGGKGKGIGGQLCKRCCTGHSDEPLKRKIVFSKGFHDFFEFHLHRAEDVYTICPPIPFPSPQPPRRQMSVSISIPDFFFNEEYLL